MPRQKFGPELRPPSVEARQLAEPLPNTEVATLQGHDGAVLAVRFNKSGTYCLTCGKDRTLKLWNPHRGVLVKTYQGHGHDVRDVAVSADNSKLASCGGDRNIFQWDVSTGKIIRKFRGHDGDVNAICAGASDEVLISGGYDQAVKVWDCRSRNFDPIQTMKVFGDSVMGVAAAEGSTEIVAGSVDGTVRRFDIRSGMLYSDTLGQAVTQVALSHDGNCVLASCLEVGLRLLDMGSGELLARYAGHVHQSYKLDCAFSPTDAYVLCGSEDGRVFFWDLVEEAVVLKFQAHKGPVCSLAYHPQGQGLLTASNDGTVKFWQHQEAART